MKGHESHIDIEGHQSKATWKYSLTKSKTVTEELLMTLIFSLSCDLDFPLVSFSLFPSWIVYLLPLAGSYMPDWAPIPIC